MTQLPMTPHEKSQRARKIALCAGGVAFAAFILFTSGLDKAETGTVIDMAHSEPKNAVGRPSRDDVIVVGSIPPKIEQGDAEPQAGLQVKRVQLPSSEAIRASLGTDKKAARFDSLARGFETCLPHCETRDPLVFGMRPSQRADLYTSSEVEEEAVTRPAPAQPDRSLLERGGDFLGAVADMPSLTIDKGRQVIRYAGGLFQ